MNFGVIKIMIYSTYSIEFVQTYFEFRDSLILYVGKWYQLVKSAVLSASKVKLRF